MKLIRNKKTTRKNSNSRINEKNYLANKGITLIALIITIIILLILAGVTIQFTLGENGILHHAETAGEKYSMQSVKEELELDVADIRTKIYKEERRKATLIDINNLLNKTKYNTELHYEPLATTTTPNTIPTYLLVTRINTKYTFIIDDKYEIKATSSTSENGGSNGGNSDDNDGDETLVITSITLANDTLEIPKGNEETINVTLEPSGASKKKLNWTSSNEDVATVDENGKIKALKTGTVTITVSSKDDNTVNNTCTVTIGPREIGYSWDEIAQVAAKISDDPNITNETPEISVEMNGKIYTIGVGDIAHVNYDGVSKRVRVLGFNHDLLADSEKNSYNDEKEHTKAGISFEFTDVLFESLFMTSSNMATSSTYSGAWETSSVRNTLSTETINKLIDNKHLIKSVKKEYSTFKEDRNNGRPPSTVKTSIDKLWCLSCKEVTGNSALSWLEEPNTFVYKLYKDKYSGSKLTDESMKKFNNTEPCVWWLRSVWYSVDKMYDSGYVYTVGSDLRVYEYSKYDQTGVYVAPGFAI